MIYRRISFTSPQRTFRAATTIAVLLSTTGGRANVVGTDAQNFNTTTSGLDFVTVHSSETLQPCVFNLGLFVNHAVNTLPYFDNQDSDKQFRDSVTGADFNVGYGIMKNWDLGLSFPQILAQSVKSDKPRAEFSETGNSEIRANTKVRLWGTSSYGVAVIGTVGINRITDNPYTGSGAGPTTTLEVAADTTVKRVALGINAGYRFRRPGEPVPGAPMKPLRNQYIASGAASLHFPSLDTKLIAEVFTSFPSEADEAEVGRQQSSSEALLGLKYDVTKNVALHVGGGTELANGVSSPDYRFYGGLNVAFGPICNEHNVKRRVNPPKNKITSAPPPSTTEAEESDELPPPTAGTETTIVIRNILFAFDSDFQVLQGAKTELDKLVNYINQPPVFTHLVIEGHTDSMGTDAYNQNLSQRRADSIKKYLLKHYNLPADKVESVGHGEARPVSDNGNYQGRQLNRRVEFHIFR